MARTYAAEIDYISQLLQDTGNALWADAELDYYIQWALREISKYEPVMRTELLPVETREGSATSTTASALVDATNSQFVSTDADKVIYNYTDKTWAIVTAYVSATQLTLSKDIMVSGENYKMFNRYVNNPVRGQRQVDISNLDDWLWIESAEYPLGYKRNVEILDLKRVLDIQYDGGMDDTDPNDADSERETRLHLATYHRLPNLTDTAGAVNLIAGYAAGSTSMAIDAFSGTEVIPKDTLFTIASVRGTYHTTASLTLSGGGGTISFAPGLLDAAEDNDVITITASTLTPRLEEALAFGACQIASLSKARSSVPKAANLIQWSAIMKDVMKSIGLSLKMRPYLKYPRT